jgi:hypothetical protein
MVAYRPYSRSATLERSLPSILLWVAGCRLEPIVHSRWSVEHGA